MQDQPKMVKKISLVQVQYSEPLAKIKNFNIRLKFKESPTDDVNSFLSKVVAKYNIYKQKFSRSDLMRLSLKENPIYADDFLEGSKMIIREIKRKQKSLLLYLHQLPIVVNVIIGFGLRPGKLSKKVQIKPEDNDLTKLIDKILRKRDIRIYLESTSLIDQSTLGFYEKKSKSFIDHVDDLRKHRNVEVRLRPREMTNTPTQPAALSSYSISNVEDKGDDHKSVYNNTSTTTTPVVYYTSTTTTPVVTSTTTTTPAATSFQCSTLIEENNRQLFRKNINGCQRKSTTDLTWPEMKVQIHTHAHEILTDLYVGDYQSFKDILKKESTYGFTKVIKMTPQKYNENNDKIENFYYVDDPFKIFSKENHAVELYDFGKKIGSSKKWVHLQAEIKKLLFQIKRWLAAKQKILVFCTQGISQSALVVISYIMWKYEVDYKHAFAFAQNTRLQICPNDDDVKIIEQHIVHLKTWDKVAYNESQPHKIAC